MSSDSSYSSDEDSSEEELVGDLVEVDLDVDLDLIEGVRSNDATAVQHALRNGANVNYFIDDSFWTPLMKACHKGFDEIVRILLEAGADPWWRNLQKQSAIEEAVEQGHLSIVELLINHDISLLEIKGSFEQTPLLRAINGKHFEIVYFLLDRGANALAADECGMTTLILACECEEGEDLELVRRLLAAGVPVDARGDFELTALHHIAQDGDIETMRELIVEHNANIFAADEFRKTPFDCTTQFRSANEKQALLIECYGNILTQEHGRLALHAVLWAAEYEFADKWDFHPPPQNHLRVRLPLGELTLQHFRTLLSTLDPELVRTRDESGQLPIHIACRDKAPVEVLALIVEQDAATRQLADYLGALPLHVCCCGAVDDSSVRFLVEQGGVGTLAARNQEGSLPLHILCGSTNPPLRTIQYMIQSFSGSVAAQTNAGQYPFMIAACKSSTASLSVVYELVRTNPDLIVV